MKVLGVVPASIKFFSSYLDFRTIATKVGESRSKTIKIYKQVSEGSPLSSTLFLLMICDINSYLKFAESSSFADDQCQTVCGTDLADTLRRAEIDSNNTVEYFKINKFAIQASKTSMIVIRPKNEKFEKA